MIEFYDRTSYLLFPLEIPHVRGAELMSAVRFKLGGLYPGSIAERNIQIRKNGNKKWEYLVFVLDKNTGHAMLPLTPLFVQHVFAQKSGAVLYVDKRWLDYIRVENGAIRSSTVKTREDARLIDDVKNLCGSETGLTILCDVADRTSLESLNVDSSIRFLDSHAELKKTDIHKISLFSEKSPATKRRRFFAVAALLLALSAGVMLLRQQRENERERSTQQRLEQEHQQRISMERQREEQRLAELKFQYQEIVSAKTATPFDIATVIAECAGPQTRIQSATFNSGFFQIEGTSRNSLDLLGRFEQHRLVSGARLHQVHPSGSQDTFALSGNVRAETVSVGDSGLSASEQIAVLEDLIAAERNHAASERQLSPSAFGESVKALFEKWGLAINSYQFMNEPNVTEIEYSLRGPGSGFFSALHEIHASHRLWDTRLTQIRNLYPRNMLDVVLRIRTDKHLSGTDDPASPSSETVSPYPVASITRNYFTPMPAPRAEPAPAREPAPPVVTPPAQTERVSWLEYVGRVNDEGDNRFIYIKNTRTGELLKLGQSSEGDMRYALGPAGGIIAYIDGHIYEINRR